MPIRRSSCSVSIYAFSLTLLFLGGGLKSGSWNPFGDLGAAPLNKVSTPIRQSTCTSRRLGGCGRRYRRSCDRATGRRCGRLPKQVLRVINDAVEVLVEGH